MVINVLAELLNVGSRSDGRNQLLEVVLEGADILDVEKEKVFRALGEAETMHNDSKRLNYQKCVDYDTYTMSPERETH